VPGDYFYGASFSNGVYFALGNSTLTSTDGSNWKLRNLFGVDVTFGKGTFVATGSGYGDTLYQSDPL
jgi:hypothetical protein